MRTRWPRRGAIAVMAIVIALVAAGVALAVGHQSRTTVHERPAAVRQSPPAVQIAPGLERSVDRRTGGRLTTVDFYSSALHRVADYLVYLPKGYSARRPLPVFYMLHGMPGLPVAFVVNEQIEIRLERLIAADEVRPMILVFPDGRIDGRSASDSEWANTPSGDFASYVIDVVQDVDHRFAALACRQERAITGISAGAYGATNIGLHNLSTFGLIQSWSGYYVETHNGVFADASPATMAANSPLDYVRTLGPALRRWPLRMYLYGGRDDMLTAQLPGMVRVLSRLPVHFGWAIVRGGHSWRTWNPHADAMLEMASDDFADPLAGGSPTCATG